MASRNIPVGVSLSVRIGDGPFYKDRPVAVVGGGNSGVEAAIDLAGICSHVTVLEFMDSLKADVVLQDKLRSLPNVEVFTSGADDIRRRRRLESDRRAIQGPCERRGADDSARRRLRADRAVGQQRPVRRLAGAEPGRRDRYRRLLPDGHSRRLCGGDVSTVPYKQIVVAMGEGAKAALSAFDDRVRGVIG